MERLDTREAEPREAALILRCLRLEQQKTEINDELKKFKAELETVFKASDKLKKLYSDKGYAQFAEFERKDFDKKALEADHPGFTELYTKVSTRTRMTLKAVV